MKILVLQLKRIGDLILTTPALAALRAHHPEATITLIIEHGCRDLIPALGFADEILVFNRRGANGRLWRRLAFACFDICLDFTGNDRSALISILSKAGRRVTFAWVRRSPARALLFNRFVASSIRDRHTVDHYLDLLHGIDIASTDSRVILALPDWAEDKARQLRDAAGISGRFAMIHPGTARPEKYWLPERWAAVIEHLRNTRHIPCLLTGSGDPAEKQHIAAIQRALAEPCADVSGRTDLLTLAAMARDATLVLSVDSAAMHMAGAFETPQIALFGPTNPFHWRPRHAGVRILAADDPAPVADFHPRHKGAPMSEIDVAMVTEAISEILPA